jgi:hypothetical protein
LALAALTARASVIAAEARAVAPFTAWRPVIALKAALRAVTALKPAFLALATFTAWASVVTAEAGPVAPLAAWGGRRVTAGRAATGGGFGFKGGHGQL